MSYYHRMEFVLVLVIMANLNVNGQKNYWQQQVDYQIDATLNVDNHKLTGKEVIRYTNNSPDTLKKIFIHTYWNAFKPGSNMDNRSKEFGTIEVSKGRDGTPRFDWDSRIKDRIGKLLTGEEGYTRITSCKMGGIELQKRDFETICELTPTKHVLPGQTIILTVVWES